MMGPLPLWAEVAFAAVEDDTAGTLVVDGVMLGIGLPGQVTEPITWTVENGQGRQDRGRRRRAAPARRDRGGRERERDRRVRLRRQRGRAVRHALGEGPRRHRAPRARRQPQRLSGRPERLRAAPRRCRCSRPRCRSSTTAAGSSRTASGCCEGLVTVTLEDVEPIPLPGGSWSRMVLNDKSLEGNAASLGYSVFTPGCVTAMVATRPRRSPTCSPVRASCASIRRTCRSPPARGCSCPRAPGTRSPTPATRTW